MDEIKVLIRGHNDTSNMINLRGIGESLMILIQFDGVILIVTIVLISTSFPFISMSTDA